MEYIFYFDETFHDKKITVNERGELNILKDDKSDTYVGAFVGFKNGNIDNAIKDLKEFEAKYREIFDIKEDKELKSKVVKTEAYRYGINSFNKNSYDFSYDFFEMLNKNEILLHITFRSKLECYVNEIFKDVKLPYIVNRVLFYYSLIKFIIHYNDKELFIALYEATSEENVQKFKQILIDDIEKVLIADHGVVRKYTEEKALLEIQSIIENIDIQPIQSKTDFEYELNYIGFINFLEELSIKPKDIKLVIDYEENTFEAAKKFKFGKLAKSHSKNNVRLHFSDLLAGFIGRMIWNLKKDLNETEVTLNEIKNKEEFDIDTQRLLSEYWFKLDSKSLNLYHLIFLVLIKKQKYYWNSNSSIYFDEAFCFYSLLEYFNNYITIEEYSKIEATEHQKRYSNLCCIKMNHRYKLMGKIK